MGPAVGLTIGALLSALLVRYVASPEAVVFVTLAIVFGILVVVYAFMPETMARRPGAISSLRPRARVPAEVRGAFLATVPCLFATWASAGLYLATARDRAELFAAVYIVSYLAFSVPAVLAGLAVMPLGLRTTATVYGAVVAALAIAVLPVTRLVRRPA